MTDPVSRTILLLDIERYSDRDDVEQAYLRRMLYDITDRTLERAGIDETLRLRADRGDSVMELIDANASVTALLRALLTEVPAQLRAVNRMASSSAQIRLRGVVATGYVAVDEHDGWVGSDLNHACRLLDAQTAARRPARAHRRLRAVRLETPVRRGSCGTTTRASRRQSSTPVTVDSKNGPLRAWLHGPVPGRCGHSEDHGDRGRGRPASGGSAPRAAGDGRGGPRQGGPAPDRRSPGAGPRLQRCRHHRRRHGEPATSTASAAANRRRLHRRRRQQARETAA